MAAFNQFGVIFCDFARLASQCRYSDAEKKLERAIDKERLKKIRQFGTVVSDTNVGHYKQVCYNLSDAQYLNMQKALIETVINDYPQAYCYLIPDHNNPNFEMKRVYFPLSLLRKMAVYFSSSVFKFSGNLTFKNGGPCKLDILHFLLLEGRYIYDFKRLILSILICIITVGYDHVCAAADVKKELINILHNRCRGVIAHNEEEEFQVQNWDDKLLDHQCGQLQSAHKALKKWNTVCLSLKQLALKTAFLHNLPVNLEHTTVRGVDFSSLFQ